MAWLTGWGYRKALTITGGNEAVTGYTVPLVVHYGAGSDSAGHVYLNGHGAADFADLRFTAADEATLLPIWVESKTDGDQALVWVKLSTAGAAPATEAVFIYYGNGGASSASDGAATFAWFSHFDADESARFSGDTAKMVTAGSVLAFTNAEAAWKQIRSSTLFPIGSCIRASIKRDISNTQYGFGLAGPPEQRVAECPGTTQTRIQKAVDGTFANGPLVTRAYNYTTAFNVHELRWLTGRLQHLVNGVSIVDWATAAPSANQGLLIQTYNETLYLDWLAVRKVIATEPAHTATGAEEDTTPRIAVAFSASPASGMVPLLVQFSDLSVPNFTTIAGWHWDFGDGGTSELQHPQHTYAAGRAYTVALTCTAEGGTIYSTLSRSSFIYADDGVSHEAAQVVSAPIVGNQPLSGAALVGQEPPATVIAALPLGWEPRSYGGTGVIPGPAEALIVGIQPLSGTVLQGVQLAEELLPQAAAIGDNYWEQAAVHPVRAGKSIIRGQNLISLNKDMIAISAAGRFMQRFDGVALAGESYDLTQFKPWPSHTDSITLASETYRLTVISGWPPTPPRHVSSVRHPEGCLVEWDPPADPGSAPIAEYRLYAGADAGSVALLATLGGAARHYFHQGAADPQVYKIYAYNGVLESDPTFASSIVDPDTEALTLRSALTGTAWAGLPYAGWVTVRGIALSPGATFLLKQGVARTILPTVYPLDATVQALAWSSDHSEIATVDHAGAVTGVGPGRATITATATDGSEVCAEVPVIVCPSFMVDDVRSYLQGLGYERVFTRAVPDGLERSITLVQGAGMAPDLVMPVDRPQLRVIVVAPDLGEAEERRKEVHDALHMAAPLDINGTRYLSFEALSSGEYVEKTRRGPRYVCTLSIGVERERTLGIVTDPARGHEIVGRPL